MTRLKSVAVAAVLGAAVLASSTAGMSSCAARSKATPDRTVAPAPSSAVPTARDKPAGVLCHDATVVTTEAQCKGHGGVAEG